MRSWMLASVSALCLLTAAAARADAIDFKDKLGQYPSV